MIFVNNYNKVNNGKSDNSEKRQDKQHRNENSIKPKPIGKGKTSKSHAEYSADRFIESN